METNERDLFLHLTRRGVGHAAAGAIDAHAGGWRPEEPLRGPIPHFVAEGSSAGGFRVKVPPFHSQFRLILISLS